MTTKSGLTEKQRAKLTKIIRGEILRDALGSALAPFNFDCEGYGCYGITTNADTREANKLMSTWRRKLRQWAMATIR